ncbi:hypothetical protein TRVL_00510 [Trypanosoma vivax]|uniref:Uncharacterized protein n=1 Tax=Trypanosoma vivax (strain Y486) TaxID=1055687 RepID=G0UAP9_TRYVY|nr:hypothetical protein TRVL_00510 [Trypanosoma vivax]CCC52884.1 hypothetical protein TVY486_1103680 [Trypanosoma vivax Y486]
MGKRDGAFRLAFRTPPPRIHLPRPVSARNPVSRALGKGNVGTRRPNALFTQRPIDKRRHTHQRIRMRAAFRNVHRFRVADGNVQMLRGHSGKGTERLWGATRRPAILKQKRPPSAHGRVGRQCVRRGLTPSRCGVLAPMCVRGFSNFCVHRVPSQLSKAHSPPPASRKPLARPSARRICSSKMSCFPFCTCCWRVCRDVSFA